MLKVAIVFTIGCIVLAVNSVLCFMPFISLRVRLPAQIVYVEGILSVLSCGVFVIGSALAFLEAYNASNGRRGFRGWKLEQPQSSSTEAILESGQISEKETSWESDHVSEKGTIPENISATETSFIIEKDSMIDDVLVSEKAEETDVVPPVHYIHQNSIHEELFGHARNVVIEREDQEDVICEKPPTNNTTTQPADSTTWKSIRAAHGLRAQYCELGLIASGIFLLSSMLYCATAVAGLATTLKYGKVARSIRYPQLVAASGFALASLLLIIKTQRHCRKKWWQPAVHSLGWYVNLWNFIGSAGFFFCAYFGLLETSSWAGFEFSCSYLWGE